MSGLSAAKVGGDIAAAPSVNRLPMAMIAAFVFFIGSLLG
jgi:hypothetical protein